jgi:hypothetical protein
VPAKNTPAQDSKILPITSPFSVQTRLVMCWRHSERGGDSFNLLPLLLNVTIGG